jgi:hypothetical protein
VSEFETYSTQQCAKFFNISMETTRHRIQAFEEFLSPSARPGTGKTRRLTVDDMKVLSLVHEMRNQGKDFPDIKLALLAGQRGVAPSELPEQLSALLDVAEKDRLELQLAYYQEQIYSLQEQLKDFEQLRTENIQLKTKIEMLELQLVKLESSQGDITALHEQLGELRGELKATLRMMGKE